MVDKVILEQCAKNAMRDFPFYPELGKLTRGKVRDNYFKDGQIISIATDRISAFDVIMDEPIAFKGQILTQIAKYWFEKTADIVPNHLINCPDPSVLVVKECKPFDVEFIIRGYITGSAWKDYEKGARIKSGVPLADGLQKNQAFDKPIITNTTKAKTGHDLDISQQEILERKLLTPEQLTETEEIMHKLYARGVQLAAERNLILADTKYELGLDEKGNIVLIDEVHTPDSSRYWYKDAYQVLFSEGKDQRELSKEFLRDWLKKNNFTGDAGQKKPQLPIEVIVEISRRYVELYKTVTGQQFEIDPTPVKERIVKNLKSQGLLTGSYVQIIAGSEGDKEHYGAIQQHLNKLGVPNSVEILSAHKQTRQLLDSMDLMNTSAEPVVYITVAGRSNALGGVVASAANNKRGFPVINCPPFKDTATYAVDIHSSLRMPSKIPALTVIEPENAALAAYNILKMTGAQFKTN